LNKLFFVIVIASMMSMPAHAENWKRVGVTPDGTIVEIDLDSVTKTDLFGPIKYNVNTTDGVMWLDCRGHYGPTAFTVSRHIPAGSIAQNAEKLICPH
jgi:hypothetical protein